MTFTRTGSARYAIRASPPGREPLHLPSAPGYDAWLPHDLAHFLVERHFEIPDGIFGQLAAGGNAATFYRLPRRRRDARHLDRRSARLARSGREAVARSERLAGACTAAWFAHRGMRWPHAQAVDTAELGPTAPRLLETVDRVSERWHQLAIGCELSLRWPTDP